jgi:hypothetical protein
MKKIFSLLFIMFILVVGNSYAQTKIGDNPTTVNSGSLLELESSTKGLLLPRIALSAVKTWGLEGTPTNGMFIYNTSTTVLPKGIYYWNADSAKWIRPLNSSELTVKATVKMSTATNLSANTASYYLDNSSTYGGSINNGYTYIFTVPGILADDAVVARYKSTDYTTSGWLASGSGGIGQNDGIAIVSAMATAANTVAVTLTNKIAGTKPSIEDLNLLISYNH